MSPIAHESIYRVMVQNGKENEIKTCNGEWEKRGRVKAEQRRQSPTRTT